MKTRLSGMRISRKSSDWVFRWFRLFFSHVSTPGAKSSGELGLSLWIFGCTSFSCMGFFLLTASPQGICLAHKSIDSLSDSQGGEVTSSRSRPCPYFREFRVMHAGEKHEMKNPGRSDPLTYTRKRSDSRIMRTGILLLVRQFLQRQSTDHPPPAKNHAPNKKYARFC